MVNGQLEFFIDRLLDEHVQCGCTKYLIHWQGEGPERDKWLPTSEVEPCEALDRWLTCTTEKLTITIPPRPTTQNSSTTTSTTTASSGQGGV